MKEKAEIESFYDKFSDTQKKIAYNERHFHMLDRLLNLGLQKDSNVLELGCGIGVISSLVCKVLKTGVLVATDISPKNIEIAKKRNANRNAQFFVGDAVKFERKEITYDFITLFDVLEHIHVDSHNELFSNVVSHMSEETKLVVNIPNPEYLRHLHNSSPESLQIIDQPLPLIEILKATELNDLNLKFFETYDLWKKDESQFMLFEKRTEFTVHETIPPKQNFFRRVQNKLERY